VGVPCVVRVVDRGGGLAWGGGGQDCGIKTDIGRSKIPPCFLHMDHHRNDASLKRIDLMLKHSLTLRFNG